MKKVLSLLLALSMLLSLLPTAVFAVEPEEEEVPVQEETVVSEDPVSEDLPELLGLDIDFDCLTDWESSDSTVADIDWAEFVYSGYMGQPEVYEELALCIYSEGCADLTLYFDEGGDEDTVYTFSVVVALRDEQDVEGGDEPDEPDKPIGKDGMYEIAKRYDGDITAEDLGLSVHVDEFEDWAFDGMSWEELFEMPERDPEIQEQFYHLYMPTEPVRKLPAWCSVSARQS